MSSVVIPPFSPAGPLRSAALATSFGIAAAGFLLPVSLARWCHPGDPTHREAGRWLRRFGRHVVRSAWFWRFTIEGEPPPDIRERPYVVVANHRSAADPFLLSHVPWDMRWVVKRELLDVPLVGALIRMAGDIPVDRASRADAARLLDECEATLKAGLSVMLFPEGTRNPARLGAFRSGAFHLAIRAQVPVLPIALAGTPACWAPRSPWFGRGRAVARILEPASTEGMGPRDVRLLTDNVRRRILDELRVLDAESYARPVSSLPRSASSRVVGAAADAPSVLPVEPFGASRREEPRA